MPTIKETQIFRQESKSIFDKIKQLASEIGLEVNLENFSPNNLSSLLPENVFGKHYLGGFRFIIDYSQTDHNLYVVSKTAVGTAKNPILLLPHEWVNTKHGKRVAEKFKEIYQLYAALIERVISSRDQKRFSFELKETPKLVQETQTFNILKQIAEASTTEITITVKPIPQPTPYPTIPRTKEVSQGRPKTIKLRNSSNQLKNLAQKIETFCNSNKL